MFVRAQPARSKRTMLASLPGTPAKARLAGRNTLDYTMPDGERRIRLHGTDILRFRPEGGFVIDTGGFNTVTTRARLRDFLPAGYRVGTERGTIYLNGVPFRQRVTVAQDGTISADIPPDADDKLRREIDAYMRAWRKRGMPADISGDPWVFPGADGKISADIVREWVRERYVFGRMYEWALKYAGMTDAGVAFYARSAYQRGMDATDYRRIRRYVRACLGLAA